MRLMLTGVICFLVASDVFNWDLSLAPGLSAKNALLYLLAAALAFKLTLSGFVLQMRGLVLSFAILIGYGVLTIVIAAFIIEYERYDVVKSAISLKGRFVDQMVFFLVFFYALRTSRNALFLVKLLTCAVMFANLVAVLDALGMMDVSGIETRDDGRVQGVMGESNQYAAFVSLFLPMLVTAALCWRGAWRLLSLGGLLVSTAAVFMAVSRGAFVAIIVAAVWGAMLFRDRISLPRFAAFAGGALLLISLVFTVVSVRYGELLHRRVIGDSSRDLGGASSGRTEIWSDAITRMMETPITLFTGFGWDAYWTMPFRYAPHNHYLALWFNLGLVGLICGVLLLLLAVRHARAAVDLAADVYRPVLIAFVVGTLAFSVATFFVDLYTPWIWYWAYAGLVLRIAVNARETERVENTTGSPPRLDSHGWRAGQFGRAHT